MSGITSIVEQLLGGARIPESAAPRTSPMPREKPGPKPPKVRHISPHERVLAALSDDPQPPVEIAYRASVSRDLAFICLVELAEAGLAEAVSGRYRRAA